MLLFECLRSLKGLTDTSTWPMYVCTLSALPLPISKLPFTAGMTDVNLSIRKSLLQVLVDSLIRNLANQGKIRHADFLLLCAFEDSLADLTLRAACRGGRGILVATCALCHRLVRNGMSAGDPRRWCMAGRRITMMRTPLLNAGGRRCCSSCATNSQILCDEKLGVEARLDEVVESCRIDRAVSSIGW